MTSFWTKTFRCHFLKACGIGGNGPIFVGFIKKNYRTHAKTLDTTIKPQSIYSIITCNTGQCVIGKLARKLHTRNKFAILVVMSYFLLST